MRVVTIGVMFSLVFGAGNFFTTNVAEAAPGINKQLIFREKSSIPMAPMFQTEIMILFSNCMISKLLEERQYGQKRGIPERRR